MASVSYINVDAAIQAAKQAIAEKAAALEKLDIVRGDLRNAVKLKAVTPEQRQWIEEMFPVRERVTDPTEQVARAEQRLAEVKAKAERRARK